MESELTRLIFEGQYFATEKKIASLGDNEKKKLILLLAYDSESIAIYSFVRYMVEKYKTQFWLELSIDIMINPLCFVEGAYSIALFHAKELLEMDLSIKNLERILFFYNIPEKLIDDAEAEAIAKKIIELEPENIVALEVLK